MQEKNLIFDVPYVIIGSELNTLDKAATLPKGVFFTPITGSAENIIPARGIISHHFVDVFSSRCQSCRLVAYKQSDKEMQKNNERKIAPIKASDFGLTSPKVEIFNKRITTTSVHVAEFFGKTHKDVMRAIRTIRDSVPHDDWRRKIVPALQDDPKYIKTDFVNQNILRSFYKDARGRRQFQYRLTRDGFTLLAMGFTGPKALDFKIAYINAFNEMERKLNQPTLPVPATAQNTQINTTETPRPRRDVYIGGVTVYDRMELIAAVAKFLDAADDPVTRGQRLSAAYDCVVMAQNLGKGAFKEVR